MKQIIKQIVESKFNFNIDIEGSVQKNSLSKSFFNSKSQKQAYEETYLIDLGLPSKTLWPKYNLGVDPNKLSNPEDWYGGYYAWGEIETKKEYSLSTYKFNKHTNSTDKIIKYNDIDGLDQLQLEDDAAYQDNIFFESIRYKMPTVKQFEELLEYTTNKFVYDYQKNEGLHGRLFTGKNGNELFFPAAGCYGDESLISSGMEGWYWTSTLDDVDQQCAYSFWFRDYEEDVKTSIEYRKSGMPIKPILYIN